MDVMDLLRTLLDPARLEVIGHVARAPASAEEVAERTGIPVRQVLGTFGPLLQSGLLRRDGAGYVVDARAWRDVARDLPQAPPPHPRIAFGMTDAESQVLARFFSGERLLEIPMARSKRLVVLERLALEFEPGRRYPEAQVNELLQRFHDDCASLRRYLVDEGLLDREAGQYWRSGGRIPA